MFKLPNLYRRHRGFFLVLLGIIVIHLLGGIDGFFPDHPWHDSPVWNPQRSLAPLWVWAVAHFAIAAMMIVGAYQDRDDLRLARQGCVASITMFTFKGGCYLYSIIESRTSIYSMGSIVLAILCSVAAMQEPSRQPASHSELVSYDGGRA